MALSDELRNRMNLISDLGTDLAVAFLVEKKFRQKIDSVEAIALIDRVRKQLELVTGHGGRQIPRSTSNNAAATSTQSPKAGRNTAFLAN